MQTNQGDTINITESKSKGKKFKEKVYYAAVLCLK